MLKARSWMFTPGNREKMLGKAGTMGADVTVIDVEDAVPPAEKADTAIKIPHHYQAIHERSENSQVYVRINAVEQTKMSQGEEYYECRGLEDLRHVVRPGLNGIFLPKVETASMFYKAVAAIELMEREYKMDPGSVKIVALIETVEGLVNLKQLSDVARVEERITGFTFGGVDFALDYGMKIDEGFDVNSQYSTPRYNIALHARSAKLDHVIDSPWVGLKDIEGFEKTSQAAASLGYTGKMVVHPEQIKVANKVFAPSEQEYQRAVKIIETFTEARKNGEGSVMVDGRLIEDPIKENAQRVVKLYEEINKETFVR
ncbi:CoA ester lyase [Alkalihalobacillus sp. BA299]|uniref:HpcH/HpaI aldolase/citrate lyase family protein n=1 Tax=Alkalihalobacillus sp. BA299 TaxID=2815938 RepID=UPI001ADAF59D|nr:CoA ester lyase [Alkalihalobacillus sp. BA299]